MAVAPENNPLKEQDCDCLNQILAQAPKTRELIEACKRCGLDFTAEGEQNDQLEKLAAALKREFFPGRP